MEGQINATGALARKVSELDIWPDDSRVKAIVSRFEHWYASAPTRPIVGDNKYNAGVVIWDDAKALYDTIRNEEDKMKEKNSQNTVVDCQQINQQARTSMDGADAAGSPSYGPLAGIAAESELRSGTVKKSEGRAAGQTAVIPTVQVSDAATKIPIQAIIGRIHGIIRSYDDPPESVSMVAEILPHHGDDGAEECLRYFRYIWDASRTGMSKDPLYGDYISKGRMWRRWRDMAEGLICQYSRPTRRRKVAMAARRVPATMLVLMDAAIDAAVMVNVKLAGAGGQIVGSAMAGAYVAATAAITTVKDTHKANVIQRWQTHSPLDDAYRQTRQDMLVAKAIRREMKVIDAKAMEEAIRIGIARRMSVDGAEQS
jgi:hypothetical protein